MANESYNLRGILVRIHDQDKGSMHFHYLMFIDLPYSTLQASIPAVTWNYTDIELNGNKGKEYVQGTFSTASFPAAPLNNDFVRTYYIGMCTLPENANVSGLGTNLTATLSAQGATSALTTGDPCSRKPPIVRVGLSNPGSNGLNPSFAYGIQSKLGDFIFNGIQTKHNEPDFFVIPLLWCPGSAGNRYSNVLSNISLEVQAQTINCDPSEIDKGGDDSAVMAVGCFDCTVDLFSISNGTINGNGKIHRYGPDLPLSVTNSVTGATGVEIFWAEA